MLKWDARLIELNGPSVACKIQRLPTHENQKSRIMTAVFAAGFILYGAISPAVGSGQERINAVKLNVGAFEYAKTLIKQGHIVADGRGAWSEHHPSAVAENEFIRLHGFGEYAKWHLGIDDRYAENTKRRYKFPYGDFKNVHRCGVVAAQSRAGQHKYYEVENAAAQLKAMIAMTMEAHAQRWIHRFRLPLISMSRPSRKHQ